jgi:hypothetical protein
MHNFDQQRNRETAMSHKWTEGEVREALDRGDSDAIAEILKYVVERGDYVIKRGDMSKGMYEELPSADEEEDSPNQPPPGTFAATARFLFESGLMTGEEADEWKDRMKDGDW